MIIVEEHQKVVPLLGLYWSRLLLLYLQSLNNRSSLQHLPHMGLHERALKPLNYHLKQLNLDKLVKFQIIKTALHHQKKTFSSVYAISLSGINFIKLKDKQ